MQRVQKGQQSVCVLFVSQHWPRFDCDAVIVDFFPAFFSCFVHGHDTHSRSKIIRTSPRIWSSLHTNASVVNSVVGSVLLKALK